MHCARLDTRKPDRIPTTFTFKSNQPTNQVEFYIRVKTAVCGFVYQVRTLSADYFHWLWYPCRFYSIWFLWWYPYKSALASTSVWQRYKCRGPKQSFIPCHPMSLSVCCQTCFPHSCGRNPPGWLTWLPDAAVRGMIRWCNGLFCRSTATLGSVPPGLSGGTLCGLA